MYVTDEKLQVGSFPLDFEIFYRVLLAIQGCETIVLLQEENNQSCLGSMRSREKQDVSVLAEKLGGGGHARAAGFSLAKNLENATTSMVKFLSSLPTP